MSPAKNAETPLGRSAALALVVVLAALAALALFAVPAFALKAHFFTGSFGAGGAVPANPYPLSSPTAVAVDNSAGASAHDIYVTDPANHRVEKFDSAGNFILMFGKEVDQTTAANVCTAVSGDTCTAGVEGTSPGAFVAPTFVAVDGSGGPSAGDVYVGGDELVSKFGPSGSLIASWGSGGQISGFGGLAGIAVDPAGNLFVLSQGSTLYKFAQDGTPLNSGAEVYRGTSPHGLGVDAEDHLYKIDGAPEVSKITETGESLGEPDVTGDSTGLTIDPSSSDLYVIEGGQSINHFEFNCLQSPNCTPLDSFGNGESLSGAAGLGLDAQSGSVYVANAGSGTVAVFKQKIVPNASVGAATDVTRTSATLTGHVDPAGGGAITGCHFDYVDESEFKTSGFGGAAAVPCAPAPPYAAPTEVSAEITGLTYSTGYHYRLIASNAEGSNSSGEATFTTLPAVADVTTEAASNEQKGAATLNGSYTGDGTDVHYYFQYVDEAHYEPGAPNPYSAGGVSAAPPGEDNGSGSGAQHVSSDIAGLHGATTYHFRLVAGDPAGTNFGQDQTFTTLPAVTGLKTESATELTTESATLHASYIGDGLDTHYYFEYGTDTSYGHRTAAPPGDDAGSPFPVGLKEVHTDVEDLETGTTYHYRVVASNEFGTTIGEDQVLTTTQAPSIESFSSSNLTETSADLHAQINPQQFATTYRFEYGVTNAYGQSAPVPDAEITGDPEELSSVHSVEVHLDELSEGVVYHFRVIATNKWGTTTSPDQTFNFSPPSCPNSHLRQQTGSSYLPDCRAYELVSPGNAGGTILFPGGPNTGYATSPSRLAFTGTFGTIPGAGNPLGSLGDLYVSTRTDVGWVTKYVGLPSNQGSCIGGPPQTGPPMQTYDTEPDKLANGVVTDLGMNRFLDWNDGTTAQCGSNGFISDGNTADLPSNAPYLWDAGGSLLGTWPTNLSSVSGGADALKCPLAPESRFIPLCQSYVLAASDLTHYFFSSATLSFAPGGLTSAPGSVYDNDTVNNTVTVVSKAPGGGDIQQDPGNPDPNEIIRLAGASPDGSHILMATATTPRCIPSNFAEYCPPITASPVHLYMRVNDAVTYGVAESPITHEPAPVTYVGMTPDGSKVYFTSAERLTPEDKDTSTDLYMWSEATDSLTLLSGGSGEAGNTDNCNATWTTQCGIVTFSAESYARIQSGQGGNGLSDSAIAANGDIYFYSPEQLDGTKGIAGQENVYDYRDGHPQYVTTLTATVTCTFDQESICSNGPLARFEVTPNDSHAAFITSSQVSSYNNAGHAEMYTYDPASRKIVCASCLPSGEPPSADVFGSQDGLFLTNDGRVFFYTTEALVPQDTDQGGDVYEFVDGRPQLITQGTGTAVDNGVITTIEGLPGLYGVSADGTDVYFSTFDSLVGQDQNGNNLKFYDARTDGGFAFVPASAPCAAAEECHGPGSLPPSALSNATAPNLGDRGNATRQKRKGQRKRRHEKRHHHRRNAAKRRAAR